MKINYTTVDGRFSAEFEGTEVEVFQQVSRFEEIFGNLTCSNGKESSDKIVFVARTDKEENTYLEQVCVDDSKPALRFAKRRFGQNKGKEGRIFPKNNGRWFKWDVEKKQEIDILTGKALEKNDVAN